jgi:hypothetical protein
LRGSKKKTPKPKASKGPKPGPEAATKPPVEAGLITRAEAAAALGVEPARINKWTSDGAPVAVRGSRGHSSMYRLEELRAWRDSRAENNSLVMSLSEQKTRVQSAMADRLERENLVRAGALIPIAEAVALGQGHITAAKSKLLKVGREAVNRGLPPEFKALVHELIVEALRELAQWHPDAGESKAS